MKNFLLLLCSILSLSVIAQRNNYEFQYRFGTLELQTEKIQSRTASNVWGQYVVQFQKGVQLPELSKAQYLGDRTYVLRSSDEQLSNWLREEKAIGWTSWTPSYKIHPDLMAGTSESPFLEVVLDKSFAHKELLQAMVQKGIPVVKQREASYFMVVENQPEVVEKLSEMEEVVFIHTGGRKSEPEDLRSKALHRSDLLEDESDDDLGFDGEGVSVLVRDDGMVGPHLDFKGRLFNDPRLPFEVSETHGDGVAGIIGAAGSVEKEGRGMAPGANIYATQYEASFLDNTLDLHIEDHVLYTNSSYSNGCNDGYTPNAAEVDRQIHEYPTLLHVFSAGNSNNNNCGYGAGNDWGNITGGHKQAKNAIATANVNPQGEIMNSSSRGPATDGRIKPDIAANGNNNYSTDPNNNYEPFGGTSGAAPCVAGVAAQLNEAYRSQFGEEPNSALLKAAMLNSANDAGVEGPDFVYGFGLLDAFGAYEIIRDERFEEATIAGVDDTLEYLIPVPAGVERVKVMLYWPDVPGQPMALKALVNDLNLSLGKDGNEYLPLVLDHRPNRTTLNDPAVPGIDTLNNVEQVVIQNPEEGTYTARISAKELPSLTQDFVLVYEYEYPAEEEPDFAWLAPEPYSLQNFTVSKRVFVEWINNVTNVNQKYLSYSLDGGESWKENFFFSTRSSYLLSIPEAENGDSVLLAYREGNFTDTLWEPFFLGSEILPTEIFVTQLCPTSGTVRWIGQKNATAYRLYALGEKYLEVVGETTDTFITVDLTDINQEQLFALSVQFYNRHWTERSDGRIIRAGLLDCPQEFEMALNEIREPQFGELYQCDPFAYAPEATIENTGLQLIDSFQICFQLNDEAPVCQWFLDTIMPGAANNYSLDSSFWVDQSYDQIKMWVDAPSDDYFFNDTLEKDITISFFSPDLIQDELNEKMQQLPVNARIVNPDEELSWTIFTGREANHDDGQAIVMANYFYNRTGEQDQIYFTPLAIDSQSSPVLHYNYAYSAVNGFDDQLLLIVEEVCAVGQVDTLWNVTAGELATTAVGSQPFQPSSYDQWGKQSFDLSPYQGKTIMFSFQSINGYGNNIWIDNFAVLPDSNFLIAIEAVTASDTICRNDEVEYVLNEEGQGIERRKWLLRGSNTEIFEDTLRYEVGTNADREIAAFAENDYMVAVDEASVELFPFATFRPEYAILNADSALLIANAENVDSIIWTTDDGFKAGGEEAIYLRRNNELQVLVTITIYSRCGERQNTVLLEWSSSTEQPLAPESSIYPNPGNEPYVYISGLNLEASSLNNATITIMNMNGQMQTQADYSLVNGGQLKVFWPSEYGAGLFVLEVRDVSGNLISRNKVIRVR